MAKAASPKKLSPAASKKPPARKSSPTVLNAENLAALGADRLAAILLDISAGQPAIKKRVRFELLTASGGPEDLAAEIAKRITAIAKARSSIDWRKEREFAKELDLLRLMIVERLAPANPAEAFRLIGEFLAMAPSAFERAGDGDGRLSTVFEAATDGLAALAGTLKVEPKALAEQVYRLVASGLYGLGGEVVTRFIPTLGSSGIAALRAQLQKAPAPKFGPLVTSRQLHYRAVLQALADHEQDVEAYIATLKPDELKVPHYGANIARRFLAQGRGAEALKALERSKPEKPTRLQRVIAWVDDEPHEMLLDNWSSAYIDALVATGQVAAAQAMRWSIFEDRLDIACLRDFLKALPDFEDDEAERRAFAHARVFKPFGAALWFLIQWPALPQAAELVLARRKEIDGNAYDLLAPAAEVLDASSPLAATLLLRAMTDDTLKGLKSSRYKHAARHIADCARLATGIADWQGLQSHTDYVAGIRRDYERSRSFWAEMRAIGA